jgi:hypothetical protein
MITQIFAKIYDALIAHADAMPGGFALIKHGEIYPTDASVAFIIATDVRVGVDRIYAGSNSDDVHNGFLMMDVMAPLSWSHSQLLGVAGLIRDHFNKDNILEGIVRVIETPSTTTAYRDGAFNRLPVLIRWRTVG